jgi:hypothetical protein
MRHNELLNRIARLETIVGEADSSAISSLGRDAFARMQQQATAASNAQAAATATDASGTAVPGGDAASKASFIGTAAVGSGGDTTAHYLSGEFWSNLCDEVEGLKAALDQPSDSDDDESGDEATPESSGPRDAGKAPPPSFMSSGLLLGNAGYDSGEILHPPPDQIQKLLETFFINVDPLLKILHRPTTIDAIRAFVMSGQPHPPEASAEALFCAIYFSAVTSSPVDVCLSLFGEEKPVLVGRYRLLTERALAKADYLNSTELVTLQAFAIYVVSATHLISTAKFHFHSKPTHETNGYIGPPSLTHRQPAILGANKPPRPPRPSAEPAPRRRRKQIHPLRCRDAPPPLVAGARA